MRGSDQNSELLFTQVSHRLATDFKPIVYLSNNFNQLMIVIDQTGNQRGRGVKDCLIRLRSSVSILSYYLFLTLSMQISVDSVRIRNGQTPPPPPPPPQILGAIGHPHYNEFSVVTNFVLTGFHCTI